VFNDVTTNKNLKMKLLKTITQLIAVLLLGIAGGGAATINVTGDITGNTTWTSNNTYLLQTIVYVQSNAVLSIEPGTVIKGATNATTLIARDGVPNLVSALWVARGGKLYATGTVDHPIIMTYEGDNVNSGTDVPFNLSGQWGGVVLCGNGQINSAQFAAGEAANPKYERFEGTTTDGTGSAHLFGGNNDNDNSGIMRYVSIRYPGNVFAPNRELNGLTMAAVGKGTTIEYIEVLNSSDDAFEWWGGCVNTRYLVAAFCEDDDFDTDQGYRGTNQFWFGIKPPWNGTIDSRGFETDGDLNQTSYPGNNALPLSSWAAYNVTLIGRGTNASGFGGGVGWNPRDEARPNVFNSILTDFAAGIQIDADDTNEFNIGASDIRNSILHVGAGLTGATAASMAFVLSDPARANSLQDAQLGGISYTNNGALDPRPQPGSPALSGALPGAPTPVTYRGAFGPSDAWADGWTGLSTLGYLSPASACPAPTLTIVRNGGNIDISFQTQTGCSYQLESADSLAIGSTSWDNDGASFAGSGSTVTLTRPATGVKFYRVVTQ
jgi:hypothetical protein